MPEHNESLVRGAHEAYSRGDTAKLLDIIDPGLEWTYLDPSLADPEPQTCHGREQLQWALVCASVDCLWHQAAHRERKPQPRLLP